MLFNSTEFIFIFLPITFFGFFLLGRWRARRAAIAWLVGASLFFFGWWELSYLALILFSIIFNFGCGSLLMAKGLAARRKVLLAFGITVNLALIGYFKYAGFLVSSIGKATGTDWTIDKVLLPIGISFFTFQQIAYLIDVAKNQTRETRFLDYSLFVVFFPQLIAGPIVHHRDVLPQFAKSRTFHPTFENLAVGITIFAIGLFKKVVIADELALVASPVFMAAEAGETLHFIQAWQGAFAYTFQLYFDFSGYSDMAIGLARLFGIRLPVNFASPYKATSIIDFWRRWHITLSTFLRDYLYFPLGGNRKGPLRRHVNLLTTMVLGGLWHGAGWTFVVWGALHGAYLIINHIWRYCWRYPIDRWWSRLLARAVTLFVVVLAWVPFRAETFSGAIRVFEGMLNLPYTLEIRLGGLAVFAKLVGIRFDGPWFSQTDFVSILWLIIFVLAVWILPNTQQLLAAYRPTLSAENRNARFYLLPRQGGGLFALAWRPTAVWAVLVSVMLGWALMSLQKVSEFLYFQF